MIFSSEGAGKNMLIIFFYTSSWSKSCAFTLTVTSTKLLASSLLNCKSIMHILMNVCMHLFLNYLQVEYGVLLYTLLQRIIFMTRGLYIQS